MIQTLDYERLTDIFMNVIQEKYFDPSQIETFAVAPARYHHDGIDARLQIAGSIADDLVRVLPISGYAALAFTTATQAEILDRAETFRPFGATLAELSNTDASLERVTRTYRAVMRDASENAAYRAVLLIAGEGNAANSNAPGLKH